MSGEAPGGEGEAGVQFIFLCFKLTQARDQGAAAGSVFDQGDDLLDGLGSAESMFSLRLSWILPRKCPPNDIKQI
jgi:hypothetical protein